MKQYIVDAFTDQVFKGNPAAVCVMDQWLDDEIMKKIAAENNLSETAFVVKEEKDYHLRWFTPTSEVDLCGHATLASAFVLMNYIQKELKQVVFHTMSGQLVVTKNNDLYEMDFPTYELKEIPVTQEMKEALGFQPIKAVMGLDLICVLENESQIKEVVPNSDKIAMLEGRMLHITASGKDYDCVSRSFGPKLGIVEDPVCGSAHCQIAHYWSSLLHKPSIIAYQASKRSGELYCRLLENGRIQISGKAVLFSIADIYI